MRKYQITYHKDGSNTKAESYKRHLYGLKQEPSEEREYLAGITTRQSEISAGVAPRTANSIVA